MLTNEGLLIGPVGGGNGFLLDENTILGGAGYDKAINAFGRLSPRRLLKRVARRIDPYTMTGKVDSSQSPQPPKQK